MSPYEVKLLIHIDSCRDPIPFKRTKLLQDTILDFVRRGLVDAVRIGPVDEVCNWETTKLGRAVCVKFYAVDESDMRFCGECGQELRKQEIKEMTENIAIGIESFRNATTASRCICLGPKAGEDIIDEDYQFRFSTRLLDPRTEFCATMTEEEWKAVHAVVSRALRNGKHD